MTEGVVVFDLMAVNGLMDYWGEDEEGKQVV